MEALNMCPFRVSGESQPNRKRRRTKGFRSSRKPYQKCVPSSESSLTSTRYGTASPRQIISITARPQPLSVLFFSLLLPPQSIVQHFLVLLINSSDESLRFLSFRLDFNEHYRFAF